MGSVSLSCSHCSAASIHCNIAVLQSEIRTPNSTKYLTIRNKMSYYRVRDCYDDMLHQRRQRSCSLPREDLGYGQDMPGTSHPCGPTMNTHQDCTATIMRKTSTDQGHTSMTTMTTSHLAITPLPLSQE